MTQQRFFALLFTAVVVLSGALYLSSRRNPAGATPGMALLPLLSTATPAVTAIMVRKGSATPAVTVHKIGNQWSVAERGGFPADVSKLRKLLSSLGDAKIIEEKTSDPTRYAAIGVEDPSQPDATGTEITVSTAANSAAFSVIVGKTIGAGNFVRRSGEQQSFSVEPALSVATEARLWIDSRLIDVPVMKIQRIDIKPASGPTYALSRIAATDNTFSLEGTPEGRQALAGAALAPSTNILAALTAEDVETATAIDFSHATLATVTLSDGSTLTLKGAVIAAKHWIEVENVNDAALTAKAKDRAFAVASYRYDAIFKPLDQLLVPKESASTPGTHAAGAHLQPLPAATP